MFYKIHNILKETLSNKLNYINLMFKINTSKAHDKYKDAMN